MIEQVEVERLDANRYRLIFPFAGQQSVEVHGSLSPEFVTTSGNMVRVVVPEVEIAELPFAPRHYFHIRVDGADTGVVAHRHIPLQGTPNFRDFGGYRTQDGRRVRWGRLYRSGFLSALTESDLDVLKYLNIGLVCDFRSEDERQRRPSRWALSAVPRTELLPLAPGNQAHTLKALLGGSSDPDVRIDDVIGAMESINREFVVDHCGVYGRLLQLVLDEPGAVLIHCAAGKDRTGFGAAVILAALGVSESNIMEDYMLTRRYLHMEREIKGLMRRYELSVPQEVVEPVIEVRPQYLSAAFDLIKADYGDFATYLSEGLGFGESAQRELKARLLI